MDRNCDKCIHHTSGMCDSWDCKMQTVEGLVKETREKAIEEFAERLKSHSVDHYSDYLGSTIDKIVYVERIDKIAKEMKGE